MKHTPGAPVPGPGRYTVDAAAKALELLSTFSFQERRLSLSKLARHTGIPRATAFRLLSTLEAVRLCHFPLSRCWINFRTRRALPAHGGLR